MKDERTVEGVYAECPTGKKPLWAHSKEVFCADKPTVESKAEEIADVLFAEQWLDVKVERPFLIERLKAMLAGAEGRNAE